MPTGADVVINLIRSRRFVHRLIIGHNELRDEGCRRLFNFLCSDEGKKYDIQEISLNANGIGDECLLSVSQYLKNNKRVRELFLQNNDLRGAPSVAAVFVEALNSSRLEILSLTTNKYLSDPFIANFLPALDAPHLHELQLSAIGLTSHSGKVIAAYLSSPRCRLQVLRCNGNSLGLRGIKPIVRAIERQNYSLRNIEFYANQLQNEETDSGSTSTSEEEEGNRKITLKRNDIQTWKGCEALVKTILLRNTHLKREVNKQSVILLRYARPLLLLGQRRQNLPENTATERQTQLQSLPLELQHHILYFLAPSLSSSQRTRVFDYATSVKTLPQLLPSLYTLSRSVHVGSGNGMTCILDPSSIEFAPGETIWPVKSNHNPFKPACSVGRCMGSLNSLLCGREKERIKFLEVVGCDVFDLEPGEGARSSRELYTLSLI
ncbi:hypothetical protein AN958_05420 [Leucoagaricus sp. SymC.cos]|nr:hypothetical protein AN958_05420 [Leucoagaricus sp. SymC.cos]